MPISNGENKNTGIHPVRDWERSCSLYMNEVTAQNEAK
jgi:hypothetical protein